MVWVSPATVGGMREVLIGGAIALVGAFGGAVVQAWLSGRAAAKQWDREQTARHRGRIVELVEALLISASDGAVAFGRPDRGRQAEAVLEVARDVRLLCAHAGKIDPDLTRVIEQADERFRKAESAKDNSDALTTLTVLAEMWLEDPAEFAGKQLSDFEPGR